ncbi:hypothetical protein C8Q77DRAFT_838195 [Trametes polyzona]|nr:hypothetical protein C8Q77DRAFT_838195 [Trametes polyzona]
MAKTSTEPPPYEYFATDPKFGVLVTPKYNPGDPPVQPPYVVWALPRKRPSFVVRVFQRLRGKTRTAATPSIHSPLSDEPQRLSQFPDPDSASPSKLAILPQETTAHIHTIHPQSAAIPIHLLGTPPAYDLDGRTPVFLGRVPWPGGGVQPCKVVSGFYPPARVPFGGREHVHNGIVDILKVDERTMEWVSAAHGAVPAGRRPVEGGRESNGEPLYFALAPLGRVWVPGKVGPHLPGAHIAFGGREHIVREGYDILCWRD